ncbi:MAG: hypothetical protein CMJ36_01895 [Phycisphaerae bacterium]|nr:hypothetical protein [Phycisphaerae bacterium]
MQASRRVWERSSNLGLLQRGLPSTTSTIASPSVPRSMGSPSLDPPTRCNRGGVSCIVSSPPRVPEALQGKRSPYSPCGNRPASDWIGGSLDNRRHELNSSTIRGPAARWCIGLIRGVPLESWCGLQATEGQHDGIIVRGLVKRFGRILAVDNLDLDVEPGSVVGFLGHNGAGKTTSMRMICGVLPPTRGSIRVGGHDLQANPSGAAGIIGYLPEGSPLYPELRVLEYLRFRSRLYSLQDPVGSIDRAVDRCGLRDVVTRPIGQLSRGYRQRVGLAAAILHDPAVLVLDEPTSGLDPLQVIEVRQLIEELSEDRTILLSTHVLQEVEAICDRVILLARGRLVAQGDLASLRSEAGMESASLEDLFVSLTAKAFSSGGSVS